MAVVLWDYNSFEDAFSRATRNGSHYLVKIVLEYNVLCGWLCGVFYGIEILMLYDSAYQLEAIFYDILYSAIS